MQRFLHVRFFEYPFPFLTPNLYRVQNQFCNLHHHHNLDIDYKVTIHEALQSDLLYVENKKALLLIFHSKQSVPFDKEEKLTMTELKKLIQYYILDNCLTLHQELHSHQTIDTTLHKAHPV